MGEHLAAGRLTICTIAFLACPVQGFPADSSSTEIVPADSSSTEIKPVESCADRDPGCPDYLRLGDSCYSDFMQRECRKVCSLCAVDMHVGGEDEDGVRVRVDKDASSLPEMPWVKWGDEQEEAKMPTDFGDMEVRLWRGQDTGES